MVAILEKALAIYVVNSTEVRRCGQDDSRRRVDNHENTRTVERIPAEQLCQHTAVGFIDITQRVVDINDLSHFATQLLVRIVPRGSRDGT